MRKLAFSSAVLASLLVGSIASAQDLQPPPSTGQPGAPAQPGEPGQPAPRNGTEADLQKGETEDSGLGLEWVYLKANAGLSYVNLKSFNDSTLAIDDYKKSGLAYGFGAGIRLLFLSLGLRAVNHTAMNLWQINADVGLHMRVSRLDGYLGVHGGYDTVGSLNQSVSVATNGGTTLPNSGVDVHGWNFGLAFGIDYYLAHMLSIGGEAAGDILFLKRPVPPIPFPAGLTDQQKAALQAAAQQQPLYQNSGSSVGFAGTLTAHVAVHF